MAASRRDFAHQHKLAFPMISDTDGSLRKLFGVPKTLGLFPGRVTYVLDKEGIVRLIYSAQLASDEHVQQALKAVGQEWLRLCAEATCLRYSWWLKVRTVADHVMLSKARTVSRLVTHDFLQQLE